MNSSEKHKRLFEAPEVPSEEELMRYARGELSGEAKYKVEKYLAAEEESLEGMEGLEDLLKEPGGEAFVNETGRQVFERFGKKDGDRGKVVPLFRNIKWAVAALLVGAIAVTVYLFDRSAAKRADMAMKLESPPPPPAPPGTDQVPTESMTGEESSAGLLEKTESRNSERQDNNNVPPKGMKLAESDVPAEESVVSDAEGAAEYDPSLSGGMPDPQKFGTMNEKSIDANLSVGKLGEPVPQEQESGNGSAPAPGAKRPAREKEFSLSDKRKEEKASAKKTRSANTETSGAPPSVAQTTTVESSKVYKSADDKDEAITGGAKADEAKNNAGEEASLYRLAMEKKQAGRWEEALSLLERIVKGNANASLKEDAEWQKALILESAGKKQEASALLGKIAAAGGKYAQMAMNKLNTDYKGK